MNGLINGFWEFLSIDNIFFTVWGYPMSYVEFIGTVLNIVCVYLASKANKLNWPIGIVASVLYIALFYQIQLYSDLGEQIYFVITGFYVWLLWTRGKDSIKKDLAIGYNDLKTNAEYILVIIVGTLLLTEFMKNIDIFFPEIFVEPAAYPFWDALTTVMSFAATILMAKKRVECWYLWILVDVIGVQLYFAKDVKFIALEYVIFLALAIGGWLDWRKRYGKSIRVQTVSVRA